MWSHDFFETILRSHGYRIIAGVDEVGRGALAGPVVAAAVVLDGLGDYGEIRDSKVLSPRQRERIAAWIRGESLAMGIGSVTESEIDRINILQATHHAMRSAIESLPVRPDVVLVDGFWLPGIEPHCIGIVHGDSLSYSIAAASIIAKVHRDNFMSSKASDYPEYGFDRHKGYGTREHFAAIGEHGPCPLHRRTFAGVVHRGVPGEKYAR